MLLRAPTVVRLEGALHVVPLLTIKSAYSSLISLVGLKGIDKVDRGPQEQGGNGSLKSPILKNGLV